MIIRSDHPAFWTLYSQLTRQQDWQSPIHGVSALDYYRQMTLDQGNAVEDCSYLLLRDGTPVAAFIGSQIGNHQKDLLACQVPCISVEDTQNLTGNAVKDFLRQFDVVLQGVDGQVRYRDFLPDGKISALSRYLLARGATSETLFHRVIDLRAEVTILKRNIRKSYGSLINWGLRELNPTVVTHEALTWEQMNDFRKLHIREAGRETRSEKSWRKQFDWVKSGAAFVVLGHWQNELVSAGLFEYNQSNCIYGVSASRRDLFEKPLFHALMWTAMLHAKELGCHWFEVGQQVFPNHPAQIPPSSKEIGISDFKAGFGGETRVILDLCLNRSVKTAANVAQA